LDWLDTCPNSSVEDTNWKFLDQAALTPWLMGDPKDSHLKKPSTELAAVTSVTSTCPGFIPSPFDDTGSATVLLHAPQSIRPAKERNSLPLVFLNKSQVYTLEFYHTRSTENKTVEITVYLEFHEQQHRGRSPTLWSFYYSHHQRLLSYASIGKSSQVKLVASGPGWYTVRSKGPRFCFGVVFHFLSTDFSNAKGVKGIPMRCCLQISWPNEVNDLYEWSQLQLLVKTFRDKGAERKRREELRRQGRSQLPTASQTTAFVVAQARIVSQLEFQQYQQAVAHECSSAQQAPSANKHPTLPLTPTSPEMPDDPTAVDWRFVLMNGPKNAQPHLYLRFVRKIPLQNICHDLSLPYDQSLEDVINTNFVTDYYLAVYKSPQDSTRQMMASWCAQVPAHFQRKYSMGLACFLKDQGRIVTLNEMFMESLMVSNQWFDVQYYALAGSWHGHDSDVLVFIA
jgi:hypothetical protein